MRRPFHRAPLRSTFGRLVAALVALHVTASARAEVLNFVIRLDGLQAGVNTTANGTGTATFDTATNLFSWSVTFIGLSSAQTTAHFHGPAGVCVDAPPTIQLPNGSPLNGSATLDLTSQGQLRQGLWYINIHTANNPNGEIRGQVVPTNILDLIPAPIPPAPVHVQLQTVASGLTAPNWGTSAPGLANRLFVTDQNGVLWSVNTMTGDKTTFLNVSAMLVPMGAFGPGTFDERGLLGVAFHPNYQTNGLVYTFQSEPVNGIADFSTLPIGVTPNCQTVIREWHVPNPSDPASVVDPGSTRVLLRIDKPQFNHNAGALVFGPDDLLYIAFGDGGGADDQDSFTNFGHGCAGNGQNLNVILGKIIRIDPLGSNSANGQYGIPADNPFVGIPGLDEIWCYGLRNPFRFSFDRGTGTMYIGDVGQNRIEEVDIGVRGGNFGWRAKEGSFFFIPNGSGASYATSTPQAVPFGLIDPIAEYDHSEGVAVLGGFVYRGKRIAPLLGRYVFGEFADGPNNGRLFMLSPTNQIQEFPLVGQTALGMSMLGLGEDANGEIYVFANATGLPFGTSGVVLRLTLRPGDVNGDGIINVNDLLEILVHWGECPAPPTNCPPDIAPWPTGDGHIDVNDLLQTLSNWS